MKKVIILKKIQVTMNENFHSFTIFQTIGHKNTCSYDYVQTFQFMPEQKKEVMRVMRKKHIYASAANLVHVRMANLNWCKWGHC